MITPEKDFYDDPNTDSDANADTGSYITFTPRKKRQKSFPGCHDWKVLSTVAANEFEIKKLTKGYSWHYSEAKTKTYTKITVKRWPILFIRNHYLDLINIYYFRCKLHTECQHLLKICMLPNNSADIFEDGEHASEVSVPNYGLPPAVKEKAAPLFEGIVIIIIFTK